MSPTPIDVLITAFNAQRTIESALASIQAQTVRDIRIVVVDDGSTDATAEILARIAGADDRIVIVSKEHSGIVASIERGLANCTAPYLARFDADDISYPHRLAWQRDYLDANPHCIATSSAADHIDGDGRPLGTTTQFPPLDDADARWIPSREPYLLQPFLMLRRASLDAVGGYRRCEVAEDSDLYWRLREIGLLHNTDEVLGAYRWNPESISSKTIVSGRRIAYWSQLVALSVIRRAQARPDLVFDEARLEESRRAVTLADFCAIQADELDPDEAVRLRIASSLKLLEAVWRRPFELERSDCRFIGDAVRAGGHLVDSPNRREARKQLMGSAMRLFTASRVRDAHLLVGPSLPYVALRVALKKVFPGSLYARLSARRR